MIREELLDILVCPRCKGDLTPTEDQDGLVCESCKLLYPVRKGVPIMLIEEAIVLK